jgi:anti-sigma regulatory factor (Ser/Thr protein kinase)
MFPERPDFSVTIPSQTQLLKMVVELTKHITTLHNFPLPVAEKISLAVAEAVTNVIKHSYHYQEDKELSIEYFAGPDGLKIKIIYTGIPPHFKNQQFDIQHMIKTGAKGGLGVTLMRRIMDSVQYSTRNGINICELIKWQKAP